MIFRGTRLSHLFVFLVIFCTLELVQSYNDNASSEDEKRAWKEFQEFREWKRSRNNWKEDAGKIGEESSSGEDSNEQRIQPFFMNEESVDGFAGENIRGIHDRRGSTKEQQRELFDPPPVDQPALMGRYIVNQADWTSVATISSRNDISSFPVANVISVSDGPLGNGTGVPYMYITPLDFTAQDLKHDNRASLMMTLAQGSYCKRRRMDPMDPRCARIILSGKFKQLNPHTSEFEIAKNAVFGRHPWLAHMPDDHHFFFVKLKIASIAVLDTFGGPKYVSVKDYFNPPNWKDWRAHRRSNAHRQNENSNFKSNEVNVAQII